MKKTTFLKKLKAYKLPESNSGFNISPSLLDRYVQYKDGRLCGIWLEKYILKKLPRVQTEAQLAGDYFEHLTLKKDMGDFDVPTYKSGPQKGTHKEPWATINVQADNWAYDRKDEGEKVIASDVTLVYLLNGEIPVKGIIDYFVVDKNGNVHIRDLKSTSVIDSRFSRFSWATEALRDRTAIVLQSVIYSYLVCKIFGGCDVPFAFDVYSTKSYDRKQVKVVFDQEVIYGELESLIMEAYSEIKFGLMVGFTPLPGNLCRTCPVKDCIYRMSGQEKVEMNIDHL